MKLMDRNGRLFGKISIIDVLVLLAVLVMAVALNIKTNHRDITSTNTPDVPIVYQVLVRSLRPYQVEAILEGDRLYDEDRASSGCLGTITAIESSPATSLMDYPDGTYQTVRSEDAVNLLLTVEGSGLISDGRYVLNRVYDLGVNSSRNFCTKYAQFSGTVTDILN